MEPFFYAFFFVILCLAAGVLVVGVFALLAAAAMLVVLGQQQAVRQKERLTALAASLALTSRPGGLLSTPVLEGSRGGMAVRVEYGSRPVGDVHVPYTRFVASGAAAGLGVQAEGMGIVKLLVGGDLETGDARFDAAVLLRGDPGLVRAVLDADTRSALGEAIAARKVVVAEGEVALEQRDHVMDAAIVASLLDEVAALARRLADPGPDGVVEKLAGNVRSDPAPMVRFGCLRALAAVHSGPATTAATEGAVHDTDDRVQLLAARLRGDTAPFRAAPVETLRAYAPHDPDGLARTLVTLGDPAPLLALLDLPDTKVRLPVLRGLAQIGTPDHVRTIQPLSKGMFGDEAVKAAARAAVEGIQARVGPAAAGRLALADDAAGAVALAAEPGRVAVVSPRGQERA